MKGSFPRRLLAVLLPLAVVLVPVVPATADDPACPFPPIADVYAYPLSPEASVLTGHVEPSPGCPSVGTLTSIDGTEQVAVGEGTFELPLGTESGTWYLSSLTTWPGETRTYPPIAPYLLRVLDLTRMTSTAPASRVAYGDLVTVSGYLEGWTPTDGWQRMPGRALSITTGSGFDGHPSVPAVTDAAGSYRMSVRLYNTYAGSAVYAGDDQWLRASSFNDAQVHGLVSADVSDRTPGVGQRIAITGKVAPGAVPVWLERLVGTEWVKASATVTAGANGRYRLIYRPAGRGMQQLRVWNDGTEPESRLGVQPYTKEFKLAVHR